MIDLGTPSPGVVVEPSRSGGAVPGRRRSAAVPLEGFAGRVCLRTSQAVYVADRCGVRFVVHDATLSAAPASVVVDGGSLPGGGRLGPGAPVRIDGGVVAAGFGSVPALQIDLDATPVHDPSLGPVAGTDPVAVHTALATVRRVAPPGDAEVTRRVRAVLDVLAVGRVPEAALDRLIGFGPGLTPSGDDALTAVLAAAHRLGGPTGGADALGLLRPSVVARLGRTTPYGAFHLEHACAGRIGDALAGALGAVLDGAAPAELERSVITLAAVGATSGRDLLTGLIEVLDAWCMPDGGGRSA